MGRSLKEIHDGAAWLKSIQWRERLLRVRKSASVVTNSSQPYPRNVSRTMRHLGVGISVQFGSRNRLLRWINPHGIWQFQRRRFFYWRTVQGVVRTLDLTSPDRPSTRVRHVRNAPFVETMSQSRYDDVHGCTTGKNPCKRPGHPESTPNGWEIPADILLFQHFV